MYMVESTLKLMDELRYQSVNLESSLMVQRFLMGLVVLMVLRGLMMMMFVWRVKVWHNVMTMQKTFVVFISRDVVQGRVLLVNELTDTIWRILVLWSLVLLLLFFLSFVVSETFELV